MRGTEWVGCQVMSESDVEYAAYGIEVLRTIASNEPLKSFQVETAPGPTVVTREELKDWVRTRIGQYNHGKGTARMGNEMDPQAVCNSRMQVIGTANLWVGDNSVFPENVFYDAVASAVLAGERVVDFVKEEYGW